MRKLITVALLLAVSASAQNIKKGGASPISSFTANCIPKAVTAITLSCSPLFAVDANTVAQANGVTGQTLYVYRTVDNVLSPTNYERLILQWNSGQTNFRIGTEAGGSGSVRAIDIGPANGVGFLGSGGARVVIISSGGSVTNYKALGSLDAVVTRGTLLASTGLVANSGPTTILTGNGSSAGLYNVCFQASTTTSGTGTTGTVTLAWNDGNAKSFTTGTWALNAVDVTGQVNSCQTIRVAASQNITISTTIGAIGTSVYRLDASVMQLQ